MATAWFLDVDGVLSPFGRGGAFTDWVQVPHERYELWLSPTQSGLIRGILERTGAELIWVTTWAEDVAEYVEPALGWPTHRFAPRPHAEVSGEERSSSGLWWKLEAVAGLLEELQPDRFVWSDDDHPLYEADVHRVLGGFDALGLVQAPRPHVGLSRGWLREAEEHLSGGLASSEN